MRVLNQSRNLPLKSYERASSLGHVSGGCNEKEAQFLDHDAQEIRQGRCVTTFYAEMKLANHTFFAPYFVVRSLTREMIASLNIGAAVHGTVDDNMAVHATGDEGGQVKEGERLIGHGCHGTKCA